MVAALRRLLLLDDPAAHLSPPQLAVATVVSLAVAAAAGWIMQSPALAVGLVLQLTLSAWGTPRERETLPRRTVFALGWAMLFSGMLALGRLAARL